MGIAGEMVGAEVGGFVACGIGAIVSVTAVEGMIVAASGGVGVRAVSIVGADVVKRGCTVGAGTGESVDEITGAGLGGMIGEGVGATGDIVGASEGLFSGGFVSTSSFGGGVGGLVGVGATAGLPSPEEQGESERVQPLSSRPHWK